uniref:Uncharacterized protein n=1 Tax=Aegilops tauschii subsp. strangulata TaxID=200361 RepID=A0A453SWC2_AEGTS
MRDPFNAPVEFIGADHRPGNELTSLSVRDYGLQNGDAKPFIPNSDTLVRHPLQGASLRNDLIAEDPNTRLMDPETKELYIRSRTQEEEILLLRKQIADASLKELQLLSEKHILERKLSDLRMAVDERQEDAISGALKQLNEKKNHIEENMRLANELKGEEEELYLFTSSLLGMLAEYDVRPPQIYPSTITTVTKRLYQQMQWKIRSLNDANRNNFPQYAQDPNDRHAEQIYNGSTFNQDMVAPTHSNYFEENPGPREARLDDDSQFYRNDTQEYSADGDPLPGIEGFQIVGDPRPGSTLRACGFPTNGTTLCNFQWVRCHEDGTRYSIEGATMYDYVVTADDVGTLLAVDCTPMDDSGRQGDLVREFANNENKITCDQEMQNDINICISRGRADFDVYVLQGYSPEEWEHATLVLRRTGYQINISHKDEVVIDEKYSPNLQTKIPNGRTTQFVLVSSGGVNLPFNTQGITEPNNEDNDVRLRDLIVLVMRTFQNKALDAKRKGKA